MVAQRLGGFVSSINLGDAGAKLISDFDPLNFAVLGRFVMRVSG